MLSPGAFRDIVVRSQYSDMAMKVAAARLMVYTAPARARRGEPTLSFISSAAAKEARRGGTAPSSAERSGAGKPEILTINGLGRFDAELGDQHADGLADLGAAQLVKFSGSLTAAWRSSFMKSSSGRPAISAAAMAPGEMVPLEAAW
jgi:hypothetical protein